MQNSFNNLKTDFTNYFDDKPDKSPSKPCLISKIWSSIKTSITLFIYTAFAIALAGFIIMLVWGLSCGIFNIGKDLYWNTLNFIIHNLSMPIFILFIIFMIWAWRGLYKIGDKLINGHLFDKPD